MDKYKKISESLASQVRDGADEKSYLRDLAAMTAEIANEKRMDGILRRWRDVNSGRMPDRVPVWARPAGCWSEMLPKESLVCKDDYNRELEYYLRQILIKRDVDDDHPVFDYFKVDAVFDESPNPPYGFEFKRDLLDEGGSSWGYSPELKNVEDFDKLTTPVYKLNIEKTNAKLAKAEDMFSGILGVRLNALPSGYLNIATICSQAAQIRGLEQLMMDMILEPEAIHHLMKVITDGVLNFLDEVEASGLLKPNIDEPMFLSDPLRPRSRDSTFTLKDCWIAGNSQEFDQVAPEMVQEFLIDYQNKIFERFGAVSYGCCENLTQKIDQVLTVPNLKIFVSSAWSDLKKIASRAGDEHCIMWRHSASDVTCLSDLEKVKKDTTEGVSILKGCRYQIVLRELQSLFGRPGRIHEWVRMCKEIVSA